ncbi:hypothetical protein NDU88_012441, partial [Pleurodeles waltl]
HGRWDEELCALSAHVCLDGLRWPSKHTCALMFLQPGCLYSWAGETAQAPELYLSGSPSCSDQS